MNQMQLRNDIFRKAVLSRPQAHGKVAFTIGVRGLPKDVFGQVIKAIKTYSDFPAGNDPHKEHDFGVVQLEGHPKIYWKIDYFENANCDMPENEEWGENESDFLTAYRLMTVMLAEEY
ncbi:DUF3768 domain-containing protein [Candidatus Poribacteria bacterium]|nr:DUF3768 domain-containing protein [Candidatus Poribacteria bacterium]